MFVKVDKIPNINLLSRGVREQAREDIRNAVAQRIENFEIIIPDRNNPEINADVRAAVSEVVTQFNHAANSLYGKKVWPFDYKGIKINGKPHAYVSVNYKIIDDITDRQGSLSWMDTNKVVYASKYRDADCY